MNNKTPFPPFPTNGSFPPEVDYTRHLHYWVQLVLPLVYDDSLSYYELLGKVVNKLNELTSRVNELAYIYNHIGQYIDAKIDDLRVEIPDMIKEFVDPILREELQNYYNKAEIDGKLVDINNSINTETAARQAADADLAAKITAETNRATAAENDLSDRITTEVNDRKSEIARVEGLVTEQGSDFQAKLAAETAAREKADNDLQTNINTEVNARTAADEELQTNINQLEESMNTQYTTLDGLIDAEAAKRKTDDDALRAMIESKGGSEYTGNPAQYGIITAQTYRGLKGFHVVDDDHVWVFEDNGLNEYTPEAKNTHNVAGSHCFWANGAMWAYTSASDGLSVTNATTGETQTIIGLPQLDFVAGEASDGNVYALQTVNNTVNIWRFKADFTGIPVKHTTGELPAFLQNKVIMDYSMVVLNPGENAEIHAFLTENGVSLLDNSFQLIKWVRVPLYVNSLRCEQIVDIQIVSKNSGYLVTLNYRQGTNYFSVVKFDFINGVPNTWGDIQNSAIVAGDTYLYKPENGFIAPRVPNTAMGVDMAKVGVGGLASEYEVAQIKVNKPLQLTVSNVNSLLVQAPSLISAKNIGAVYNRSVLFLKNNPGINTLVNSGIVFGDTLQQINNSFIRISPKTIVYGEINVTIELPEGVFKTNDIAILSFAGTLTDGRKVNISTSLLYQETKRINGEQLEHPYSIVNWNNSNMVISYYEPAAQKFASADVMLYRLSP